MDSTEFYHWVDNFKDALEILSEKDGHSAEDLRNNVKINYAKRTIKYIGVNKDLAMCFLPPSCLPYEYKRKITNWKYQGER